MKSFKLIPVIAVMLVHYGDCLGQITRNEMISYYKKIFLYRCVQPFGIDTGYRDEVCTYSEDWIDKTGLFEIDSMSRLVSDEIRLDVEIINKDSSGDFYPSMYCVLHVCLNKYESEDLKKMAKEFARRKKKVNPINKRDY